MPPLWFSALVTLPVVVVALVVVVAWRQRPQAGATAFTFTMVAVLWWVLMTVIGVSTMDPTLRILFSRLRWVGIVSVPVGWFVFALQYTGRSEYVTPRTVAALSVVPLATLLLALTNQFHGLVYPLGTTELVRREHLTILQLEAGPWFWVHATYSYTLLFVGTGLFVQLALGSRFLYRGQSAALVAMGLPPFLGNAVYLSGNSPLPGIDPTPFMFTLTGLIGLVAVTQYGVLSRVPVSDRVAHRSVVDTMDAGVVVVDSNDRVVDLNPMAADILSVAKPAALSVPASDLLPAYEGLAEQADSERTTVALDDAGRTRYYELQVTALAAGSGCVVLLYDVTSRRNRSQRLDVLNRVLRHNLRNEMTVVYGYVDRLKQNAESEATLATAEKIKTTATTMVELGDKARTIDSIVERGDEPSEPRSVRTILEWVEGYVERTHPNAHLELSPPGERVCCDKTVEIVLEQLVENAIEHTDDQEPAVTLSARHDESTVTLAVADDGPGIPSSERAVVEGDGETKLNHGSGLGLWLANWVTESVGGSLDIEADVETGSVVRVTVPRLDEDGTGSVAG